MYEDEVDPGPSALDDAAFEVEIQRHLDAMSPEERAEREHGLDPFAEPQSFPQPTTEDAAVAAQARLEQLDRVQRLADAHRIVALLDAYEYSIEDVRVRFGAVLGSRSGLGAQAFFTSTALRLQTHPRRIAHLVDTATAARDRLPRTWAVFTAGGTTWARLALAVGQADGLDAEVWSAYDERASSLVTTSYRLKHDLRVTRERLQDDTAERRARTTHEQRCVYFDEHPDGAASLTLTGPAAALTAIDQALSKLAVVVHGRDDDTRTVTQLRFDAAVDLLTEGLSHAGASDAASLRISGRPAMPVQLALTVPALAWLGVTTEQAVLAGYGPIDLATATSLARGATAIVRILTDPVTGVRLTADADARLPSVALRRWIQARDQRSRFPGSMRPAHLCDIDHATEWQHGGRTIDTNLVTLDRVSHLGKSAGLWQEEYCANGTVPWTDLWGTTFIDPPPDPPDPAPQHLPPDDPPF